MSGWGNFTNLAKSALQNAQKHVDKVLDIKEEHPTTDAYSGDSHHESGHSGHSSVRASASVKQLQDDFFTAFGFGGSNTSESSSLVSEQPSLTQQHSAEHGSETSTSSVDQTGLTALSGMFSKKPAIAVADVASKLKLNSWFSTAQQQQNSLQEQEQDTLQADHSSTSSHTTTIIHPATSSTATPVPVPRRDQSYGEDSVVADGWANDDDATFSNVPLSPVSTTLPSSRAMIEPKETAGFDRSPLPSFSESSDLLAIGASSKLQFVTEPEKVTETQTERSQEFVLFSDGTENSFLDDRNNSSNTGELQSSSISDTTEAENSGFEAVNTMPDTADVFPETSLQPVVKSSYVEAEDKTPFCSSLDVPVTLAVTVTAVEAGEVTPTCSPMFDSEFASSCETLTEVRLDKSTSSESAMAILGSSSSSNSVVTVLNGSLSCNSLTAANSPGNEWLQTSNNNSFVSSAPASSSQLLLPCEAPVEGELVASTTDTDASCNVSSETERMQNVEVIQSSDYNSNQSIDAETAVVSEPDRPDQQLQLAEIESTEHQQIRETSNNICVDVLSTDRSVVDEQHSDEQEHEYRGTEHSKVVVRTSRSPSSPSGSDNGPHTADDASGSHESSSGSAQSDGHLEMSTGFTSPSVEEYDLEIAMSSSDIEILSNPTATPCGSERSSVRSGFVWAPAQIPLLAGLCHQPEAMQQALGSSDSLSSAAAAAVQQLHDRKQHRRVFSDQSFVVVGDQSSSGRTSVSLNNKGSETDGLAERLAAREQSLLDVSTQNAQLLQENLHLKSLVEGYKSKADASAAEVESKYFVVCEERDALKRKCESLQKELASRVDVRQLQSMLKEKEEEIKDLRLEGEKLSKREFQQSSVIKKLREKEKESEKMLESHKTKLKELDDCRQIIKEKEVDAQKYEQLLLELNLLKEKAEKRVLKLQSELEDTVEKGNSYKASLENCYREIAELNKVRAAKDAEITDLKNSHAELRHEDTKAALEKLAKESDTEKQHLLQQIEEYRLNIVQLNQDRSRREESLKWEISRLQQKLQDAEMRNEELSETATSATRPLLRQIESIQASFRVQQANWERVEKSLYERIAEAEAKALQDIQAEKTLTDEFLQLKSKVRSLEIEVSSASLERSKLLNELTELKRENTRLDTDKQRLHRELNAEKSLHVQATAELNREKELLASQLDFDKQQCRTLYEQKLKDLQTALEEKEKLLPANRNQFFASQNLQSSVHSSLHAVNSYADFVPIGAVFPNEVPRPLSPASVISTSRVDMNYEDYSVSDVSGGNYSTTLEKLRSRLQQRDGEVAGLKEEIRHLHMNRDAVCGQVASLSGAVHQLETKLLEMDALRDQYHTLDSSYQALLQMYGEKVEENDELRMDLADVKLMYREQIEDLLGKKQETVQE